MRVSCLLARRRFIVDFTFCFTFIIWISSIDISTVKYQHCFLVRIPCIFAFEPTFKTIIQHDHFHFRWCTSYPQICDSLWTKADSRVNHINYFFIYIYVFQAWRLSKRSSLIRMRLKQNISKSPYPSFRNSFHLSYFLGFLLKKPLLIWKVDCALHFYYYLIGSERLLVN